MNGYIINPSWFYWVQVVDTLGLIATVFFAISLIGGIIFLVGRWVGVYDYDDERRFYKKVCKIVLPVFIISLLAMVLIPSKETLIEMQIAKYATYENAAWTVESIKSIVDYIIEAVKGAK